MRRYVARKVFAAFVTLFLVLVFDFMIFRLLPNDPLDVLARSVGASEADKVEELTKQYALDQPVFPDQFVVFLRQTATLDFGEEFSRGLPTWSVIGRFAPPTFFLIGTATVLAAGAGIALGIRGGWRRTGALDRGATGLAVLLMSTPPFLLAMLMVTVFGGILRWFPVSGARSLGDVDGLALLADRMNHAVLPLITLALVAFGPFYLIMRQSMVDTLGEDFLVTARAKGIGEQAVRNRHAVQERAAADRVAARPQPRRGAERLDRDRVRVRLSGARAADGDGVDHEELPRAPGDVPVVQRGHDLREPGRRPHVRLPRSEDPGSLKRRTRRADGLAWTHARVAELADAPGLGPGARKGLGVRLPPLAPPLTCGSSF